MANQGPVKFKWLDHLNGAWVTEDCEMIANRRDAVMLFDRMVSNTEVIPLPQQVGVLMYQREPTGSIVAIWVKIFKTEKTIEIQLVRLTEVYGKVLSERNVYKSVKIALLLSTVTDADHQNSRLFTNKGHFSSPLWVLIGVLVQFHK